MAGYRVRDDVPLSRNGIDAPISSRKARLTGERRGRVIPSRFTRVLNAVAVAARCLSSAISRSFPRSVFAAIASPCCSPTNLSIENPVVNHRVVRSLILNTFDLRHTAQLLLIDRRPQNVQHEERLRSMAGVARLIVLDQTSNEDDLWNYHLQPVTRELDHDRRVSDQIVGDLNEPAVADPVSGTLRSKPILRKPRSSRERGGATTAARSRGRCRAWCRHLKARP